MGSVAVLVVLLGSMVLYQRYLGTPPGAEEIIPAPALERQPPQTASSETAGATVGTLAEAPTPPPQQLLRPLQGQHKVLQPFGFMKSEVYGDFRLHPGIDYAAGQGESVMAAAGGKVIAIEADPVEGQVLEIEHTGRMVTRYGGLGRVLVGLNATVQPGAIVAQIGEPIPVNQSVGPHLHFEVLLNDNPNDPQVYLQR
jgi:murein DD-endopeptidase MepM/ murein hydrolase activator NlpD